MTICGAAHPQHEDWVCDKDYPHANHGVDQHAWPNEEAQQQIMEQVPPRPPREETQADRQRRVRGMAGKRRLVR